MLFVLHLFIDHFADYFNMWNLHVLERWLVIWSVNVVQWYYHVFP